MELCICCWQNYRKIGPILAIKSDEPNITMLLKKLIKDYPTKKNSCKRSFSKHKKYKKRIHFFAIKGYKINGEKFINEAVKKGASAVICSKNCKYTNRQIPVIKTSILEIY